MLQDNSGILSLNRIRNRTEFKDLRSKYWGNVSGKEWLGRGGYVKEFKRDPKEFKSEIEPYTQALYKHINGGPWDPKRAEMNARTPEEAWLNKTHAGEVAVSQGFGAGVSESQIKTRMKMAESMGKKLDGDFAGIPMNNANKLWTSCFYLVVK